MADAFFNDDVFDNMPGKRNSMVQTPSEDGAVLSALLGWSAPEARDEISAALSAFANVDACPIGGLSQQLRVRSDKRPDVVVIQAARLGADVFESLTDLGEVLPCPVVVTVSECEESDAASAVQRGASAFVVGDVTATRMKTVVQVAMERFRLTDALYTELNKSKSELAARKVIERAKGLVMERSGMSEKDAYNEMRRMAMAQGKPLKAIAESVLLVTDLFQIDRK